MLERRTAATAILAGAFAGLPAAAAWRTSEIDAPALFEAMSFRVSPDGRPAVAFGDDRLYYAVLDPGGWSVEVVDGACVETSSWGGLSLAFDQGGLPAIAYPDAAGTSLHLARFDGTGWNLELVDPDLGRSGSLAFDRSGHTVIAYGGLADLRLARWDGAAWSIETVEAAGSFPSLAIDAGDRAALSFIGPNILGDIYLKFARREASGWRIEEIEPHPDREPYTSLALDSAGNPSISYFRKLPGKVRYAHFDGSAWSFEDVQFGDANSSIAVDPDGVPWIAFEGIKGGGNPFGVWLAHKEGTAWRFDWIVQEPGEYYHPSVALDPGGRPAVAVVGADPAGDIQVWRQNGAAWMRDSFGQSLAVGSQSSLVVGDAGRLCVAYTARPLFGGDPFPLFALRFAEWDGVNWRIEDIATSAIAGEPSLALDASGAPSVAFSAPGFRIGLARRVGTSWQVEPVPADLAIGPSLALDPAGETLLSWIDIATERLQLSRWDGLTWRHETVDDGAGGTQLRLDAQGHPVIAYLDMQGMVKVARWDGTAWSFDRVTRGDPRSLALDARGVPFVAIRDSQTLSVAFKEGPAWVVEPVVTLVTGLNDGISLALGPDGAVVVSYAVGVAGTDRVDVAFRELPGYRIERAATSADFLLPGPRISAGIDAGGTVYITYPEGCRDDLMLAWTETDVTLHRGLVPALDPGWQVPSLPLTSANDDETAPFPLAVVKPGSAVDAAPGSAPLTLYRLLDPAGAPIGSSLRVVKVGGGLRFTF